MTTVNNLPKGGPILTAISDECYSIIKPTFTGVTKACYPPISDTEELNKAYCSQECINLQIEFIKVAKATKECVAVPNAEKNWEAHQQERKEYCLKHASYSAVALQSAPTVEAKTASPPTVEVKSSATTLAQAILVGLLPFLV